MSTRKNLLVAIAALCSACGASDVGEECGAEREDGECVEDAICTEVASGDLVCKRQARIGEPCSNEGHIAECPNDSICGKDESDQVECLDVCFEQADCPDTEECNGVEGLTDIKACRPKV